MSHFGVLSYKGTGHLNPLIALSRQLMLRGHRVTFFQDPQLETRVRQHGLEFYPIRISNSSCRKHGDIAVGTAPYQASRFCATA